MPLKDKKISCQNNTGWKNHRQQKKINKWNNKHTTKFSQIHWNCIIEMVLVPLLSTLNNVRYRQWMMKTIAITIKSIENGEILMATAIIKTTTGTTVIMVIKIMITMITMIIKICSPAKK